MKRLALVLAILCMATQVSAGLVPKFKFGLKAGANYQANDYSLTKGALQGALADFDINSSTGWFAGAMININVGSLGIHPEVLYTHNKFGIDGANGSIKVNQVEVPLLLNYGVLGLVDIQVGPRFCLMENTNGVTENVEWKWKSPTVGYAIGLETTIWKIAISARYNGAFKKSEVMGFTTGSSRTNNFQIGVGYYF